MPRQILPGRDFKQWAPPDKLSEEERKSYVFPELWTDDITNDEWNQWKNVWEKEEGSNRYWRRVGHAYLNSILYAGLFLFLRDEFSRGVTEENFRAWGNELLKAFDFSERDFDEKMMAEGMIWRVANSLPHGIYVGK